MLVIFETQFNVLLNHVITSHIFNKMQDAYVNTMFQRGNYKTFSNPPYAVHNMNLPWR